MAIYDEQEKNSSQEPSQEPELGSEEWRKRSALGGGYGTSKASGLPDTDYNGRRYDRGENHGAAEDLTDRENSAGKDGVEPATKSPRVASGTELAEAESQPDDTVGSGYNPEDTKKRGGRWLRRNRKKLFGGAGAAVGLAGVSASIFLLLIPLKIEHIVSNLQSRFFATSENAVQKQMDKLFTTYMINHVMPGYKGKCASTIDKGCSAANLVGTNPVSNLYKAWSNGKLENKLATKYGIEFKYNKKTGSWYLKAPGTSVDGDPIGPDGKGLEGDFQKATRSQMRNAIHDAMESESKWKEVYYRFKVGRLLEEKYGIRRCIIFCGITDPLKDNITAQKTAAKLYLTDRVITPRNKTLGVALTCLFDDTCDPTKNLSSNTSDPALAGSEQSATETEISDNFKQLAAAFGVEDAEALQKVYTAISEKGYLSYIVDEMLTKITGNAVNQTATDKIPIIGWINLGNQIYRNVKEAGPKLKKLAYITNATAAVQEFSMYRTYADEIHTGNVNATEVGSMVDSLGPGDNGAKSDAIVGGTAGAEDTPLYANLIDNSSDRPSSSSNYKCNDGKPVPKGQLVCSEEVLGQGNGVANAIHYIFNLPVFKILNLASDIWSSTIGKIFQAFNFIIGGAMNLAISGIQSTADLTCDIPFVKNNAYCEGKNLVHEWEPKIMEAIVNWLIPNPFSSNMSGGRTFDMMAAGSDVAGNDSAHTDLGGKQLTPEQTATIINEQQTAAQQQFENQSFFARMFNTDSDYSLVTKVAMATPINLQASAQTDFANFLSNPFASLFHGFGSMFSKKADAATGAQADPFGVVQYGYTQADLDAIGDPETYWDQNCSDNASYAYRKDNSWNDASTATVDPDSEMPVNTTTNPCLLIKAAVGSAGAVFDSSLLTADDLGDDNTAQSSAQSSAGNVSGTAQQLAQQILSNNNIQLSGRDVLQDVQAASNNQPGTAGVMTSAAILQLILSVGQSHTVQISAIQSGGSGHCNNQPKSACPNDPHYTGDAVDFSALDGTALTGRDSGSITIMKIAFTILPSGSGFGQSQCGPTPSLPSGDTTFADTCNHLHVQVPAGTP